MQLITKEQLLHEVLAYYGGAGKLAKYCGVSRQAVYKCIERGCFTAKIAIFIERDTYGKYRAIDLAD